MGGSEPCFAEMSDRARSEKVVEKRVCDSDDSQDKLAKDAN